MALTLSNRREGVNAKGQRTVVYTCAFSDGSAADLAKSTLGLRNVDSVHLMCGASLGQGVDVTANDSTKVTLDPTGAITCDLTFTGSE